MTDALPRPSRSARAPRLASVGSPSQAWLPPRRGFHKKSAEGPALRFIMEAAILWKARQYLNHIKKRRRAGLALYYGSRQFLGGPQVLQTTFRDTVFIQVSLPYRTNVRAEDAEHSHQVERQPPPNQLAIRADTSTTTDSRSGFFSANLQPVSTICTNRRRASSRDVDERCDTHRDTAAARPSHGVSAVTATAPQRVWASISPHGEL